MAEDFAKPFYHTAAWLKCRESYIAYRRSIDGGMCEICHDVPGREVHHKKRLTRNNLNDPDITINFDNLQFLCSSCHHNIHHASKDPAEGMTKVFFSPDGESIPVPPSKSGAD